MKKYIPAIREPPLDEIIRVGQRGFGYLNPEVKNKSYLETIGLGTCIGLYVRDDKRELQALAHIDAGPSIGYKEQTELFLRYLRGKNLTDGNFDKILILKSQQASEEYVEKIHSVLRNRGYRNVEIIEGDWTIDVIFDRKGNMYWVYPWSIQAERKSDIELELEGLEVLSRNGLKCENTGEIVRDFTKDLYEPWPILYKPWSMLPIKYFHDEISIDENKIKEVIKTVEKVLRKHKGKLS